MGSVVSLAKSIVNEIERLPSAVIYGRVRHIVGLLIEIEGTPEQCDSFARELPAEIPFPGSILTFTVREIPARGETSFRIESSREDQRSITPIPPDVAVCPECVGELLDPSNRRYLYPFTTCTLCGPQSGMRQPSRRSRGLRGWLPSGSADSTVRVRSGRHRSGRSGGSARLAALAAPAPGSYAAPLRGAVSRYCLLPRRSD